MQQEKAAADDLAVAFSTSADIEIKRPADAMFSMSPSSRGCLTIQSYSGMFPTLLACLREGY
jgi:hypothetical protein